MHIIVIMVNDIIVILKHISKLGTRKRLLNTKIEPNFTDSKKSNVDEVTILEPFEQPTDNEMLSQMMRSDNIYHRIVAIMKQSTQEYYNMRIVLGLKVA